MQRHLESLQQWIDDTVLSLHTAIDIDQLLGLEKAPEGGVKKVDAAQVLDVGTGKKPVILTGNATGGVDESQTATTVQGRVLDARPLRQMRMSGREMAFLPADEAEYGAPRVKRVICGVCHRNNQVPVRTCLMECGACGTRNHAGDELAVRVQCYACGLANLADAEAGSITCARCGVAMDLPGDEAEHSPPPEDATTLSAAPEVAAL